MHAKELTYRHYRLSGRAPLPGLIEKRRAFSSQTAVQKTEHMVH